MRVLAIETSSKVLGVAVFDEDGGEVEFNYSFELRHASHLIPTIKNLLRFTNLELDDMDAYCISIGPGSFTGLRVGVATVKALSLASNKKIVAVPTLDVLAYNVPYTNDKICVVVDAKKEKFYSCFYEYKKTGLIQPLGGRKGTPYFLISYQEFLKRLIRIKDGMLLVGDGIEKLKTDNSPLAWHYVSRVPPSEEKLKTLKIKLASKEFWYPKAINVARIGLQLLKKGDVVKDADRLVPLYLHPRDIQCKK
ncbi:MAG: tRNA (adenosine(37)-N6)-threonylcarbamoyltransferase complex dimerization subunit type 1 TsaB [Candidatus Omnitrophica bacterium]|nr:tRNA (adenosine(37)-N6)-threonylcarbamoyltransferase complex dimerization subunit type 1 TsaB [Candidatus Omnitrophota bacterium]